MQANDTRIAGPARQACMTLRRVHDGDRGGGNRDRLGGCRFAALPVLLVPAIVFAANHTVTANADMTFTPSSLSIAAGDTVTFHNNGGVHNAVSDPGSVTTFSTGDPSSSAWSSTVAFPTAGTIHYFCQVHGGPGGVGMAGMITVTGSTVVASHKYDFTGDGMADVLWRNASTGANAMWRSALSSQQQAVTGVTNLAWIVVPSVSSF